MKTVNRFENNCIDMECTLMCALEKLEKVSIKVLFVLNHDGTLAASVTDGDIRRAILSGISLDAKVCEFAKKTPMHISTEEDLDSHSKALEIMRQYGITAVPVTDDNNRIQYLVVKEKLENRTDREISLPVVMMAGGKGSRLYPYTKILPKPLIPIEEVPISERIMDSFYNAGCKEFHMIVNYKKEMIKSYYSEGDREYSVSFHDEPTPLGTGGGLKLLDGIISGTFILTNCDILILEDIPDMVDHHKERGNKATMVCSLKKYEVPYGVVKFSDGGDIESLEEKPKMSFFTNTGYYILEKDVFDYIGESEVIGMPDVLLRMQKAGLKVGVYPIGENTWLDMGQFDSMDIMERKIRNLGI